MPGPSQITLYPDLQALAKAHQWLTHTMADKPWPQRQRFALQLSLDEALNNIVRHGFGAHSPLEPVIHLALTVAPPLVHLDIRDNGIPFDPTRHVPDKPATQLDDAAPGGHGVRLMQHYLHDFSYHYAEGYNNLRLTVALP